MTVSDAKTIAADTSGTVTATIATNSTVNALTELRQPNFGVDEVNAFMAANIKAYE